MKSLLIALMLVASWPAASEDWSVGDSAAGQAFFETSCANVCHQAPQARRLSSNQWRIVLDTMQVRRQSVGMPPMTDEQINNLMAYLTTHR